MTALLRASKLPKKSLLWSLIRLSKLVNDAGGHPAQVLSGARGTGAASLIPSCLQASFANAQGTMKIADVQPFHVPASCAYI